MYTYVYACSSKVTSYVHICLFIFVLMYVYIYIHVYTHTYICINIFIYEFTLFDHRISESVHDSRICQILYVVCIFCVYSLSVKQNFCRWLTNVPNVDYHLIFLIYFKQPQNFWQCPWVAKVLNLSCIESNIAQMCQIWSVVWIFSFILCDYRISDCVHDSQMRQVSHVLSVVWNGTKGCGGGEVTLYLYSCVRIYTHSECTLSLSPSLCWRVL